MASGVKDSAADLAVASDDGRAGEQRAGRCVKILCELTCMVLPNVSPWTVYSTRTDSRSMRFIIVPLHHCLADRLYTRTASPSRAAQQASVTETLAFGSDKGGPPVSAFMAAWLCSFFKFASISSLDLSPLRSGRWSLLHGASEDRIRPSNRSKRPSSCSTSGPGGMCALEKEKDSNHP